jgi:glycosyltransferase involved in cell wall biosynthesis
MACGTPVMSSNTSSLPEVCGSAARYFDPHHPEEIVGAVRSVMADESLRKAMSGHGLEQASHFSWERTADETWALYQSLA